MMSRGDVGQVGENDALMIQVATLIIVLLLSILLMLVVMVSWH